MGRQYPFEPYETCDLCGEVGAFDVMGDFVCAECLEEEADWDAVEDFDEDDLDADL